MTSKLYIFLLFFKVITTKYVKTRFAGSASHFLYWSSPSISNKRIECENIRIFGTSIRDTNLEMSNSTFAAQNCHIDINNCIKQARYVKILQLQYSKITYLSQIKEYLSSQLKRTCRHFLNISNHVTRLHELNQIKGGSNLY